MRQALTFLLLLGLCSCAPKNTMRDPLDQARQLASEGKFEESLQKHIWIHDHALEVNPAYYGVRLSFALSEWIELGNKYPKALVVLKGIRDEKVYILVVGGSPRRCTLRRCEGLSKLLPRCSMREQISRLAANMATVRCMRQSSRDTSKQSEFCLSVGHRLLPLRTTATRRFS